MPSHPWLTDPDLIVDEIMAHESDLNDKTVYKSRFEREELRQRILKLQARLREAFALRKTCP